MLEFFWTTDKNRLIVHDIKKEEFYPLTSDMHELIDRCEQKIMQDYPDTWTGLCKEYSSPALPVSWITRFQRVNRFLKCNFSSHNNVPDIDDDWNFTFEQVPCPLRGECNRGYCASQLTTNLTDREIEIIKLHVEGISQQDIGDRLYISRRTVQNHVYKIYQKLGFNRTEHPEKLLINYAYKNQLI